MTFRSILFPEGKSDRSSRIAETPEAPSYFVDLNLDQIVDAITAQKHEYNLEPFFHVALDDLETIKYRQEVMLELESPSVLDHVRAFGRQMRIMREHLSRAGESFYKYEKQRWFLEAIGVYCNAVSELLRALSREDLTSTGFVAFRRYLSDYVTSDGFASLMAETDRLKADLASIRYCVLIKGDQVTVRKYESQIDYSADVEATFAKFRQGQSKGARESSSSGSPMNHVEAEILELVAKLYPDVFSRLDHYCTEHGGYLDEVIAAFDREVQFYVAYLEYIAPLKQAGLPFCLPNISADSKEVYSREGFDLALARRLLKEGSSVVCNDFRLEGQERILIVSGPNQGGKTTFARTFGQLHHLAALGCPVPGREARLFLCDRLFTHFEKEEDIKNLRGKLQDDLVRVHSILTQATPRSIIIMNELFTSTTSHDAVFLGKRILERVISLDALCVYVTFLDELASLSEKIVSMVSTVPPDNPAVRTYKIVRKPPDGRAYAAAIAEKYRLTYACLKERLNS
ncbi:MAG: DNA mismatch repair protein MutS [Firmicutes bacterium]|jgi:DNA mismatch repair ATPase MutS|nr:DNA mismatch repair protein MutS [Bacillota bacterium]MDH7495357.1 DNA mismatch repair protein MutS [Bacillota bacterium]